MKALAPLAVMAALAGCIPIPIVVPLPGAGTSEPTPVQRLGGTPPADPGFDQQLNAFRASQGRAALVSNAGLDRVAAAHAADQLAGGYLAHRDRQGRRVSDRVRAAGVSNCLAGENLGQGQRSAQEVFDGWLASPDHRANMLVPGYANYGLGRAGDVWVLVMLRPC